MSASRRVRVAVVGYGYWGPNLVRNLSENPGFDPLVCDADPKRRAAARRRHPGMECASSFREVLADPSIEAVVLATPVSTHFRLASLALEKGKHVLVEKPLATTAREARALVESARKRRRVLLAGHTFVYSPPVRKVKELLDRKALGRVFTMDFSRVNLGLFQPDVNVIADLAPHDISISLFWLGRDPVSVSAQARNFALRGGIEEIGYLSMEFSGGVWVHSHVSWLSSVKLRRIAVVGSKKMLVYDDTAAADKVKVYAQAAPKNPETFKEFQRTHRSGAVHSPRLAEAEPLAVECADFLRAIRTGTRPLSDGAFGLRVVRVLEAAQKSLRRRGAAVRLS